MLGGGKTFITNNKTTWRTLLREAYPDDRGAEKRLYRLSKCMAHLQGKIDLDVTSGRTEDEVSSSDHWIRMYNNILGTQNKLSLSGFEQLIRKQQEQRRAEESAALESNN